MNRGEVSQQRQSFGLTEHRRGRQSFVLLQRQLTECAEPNHGMDSIEKPLEKRLCLPLTRE